MLTQKAWDDLSKEERKLLRGIGLKPTNTVMTNKTLPPRLNIPAQYYLRATLSCELCGSTTIAYYKMEPDMESHSLKSIPITPKEAEGKKMRDKVVPIRTCPRCLEVLVKEDKKDLILFLMRVFNHSKIGGYAKWKEEGS